ncbi:MAG TPA: dodecin [Acidobacteriota bacterium]|nr:dodecin [Acidobacteriota bacterium]
MPGTYKRVEIVGTSPVSFEEAIKSAVAEASNSIRHMDWFEVVEMRGMIKEGKVAEYQVVTKIGFKIDR